MIIATFDPQELADDWAASVDRLASDDVIKRLWRKDHTVVSEDPTEISNRLGWIDVIERSRRDWPNWVLHADQAVETADTSGAGVEHVLVLGMGGSSLFPEVLSKTFDPGTGFPSLMILDSTDPAAVIRATEACDPERTVVVASSKSGTTVETRSHLAYFWARHPFGRSFTVVTDPGSQLETAAQTDSYRFIAHGDPNIGGRFSALSAFGMFPAALMGLDGAALLDTALETHDLLGPDGDVSDNPAVQLGALIAVAARAGRDKLTFVIEDSMSAFGSWVEQLIAESTGKHGTGILPVVGEDVTSPSPETRTYAIIGSAEFIAQHRRDHPSVPGPSVQLVVEEPEDLGSQVFLWELATAVAGIVLGINPFDQPDVESAKKAARDRLGGTSDPVSEVTLDDALALLRDGDALVIGAFADPALWDRLSAARGVLSQRTGVPTTLGIGPRFLHSTGQMHKGGPDRIVMLQVVGSDDVDLPIPGESFTFGELIHAQADGDLQALHAAGKRAVRVPLSELLELG